MSRPLAAVSTAIGHALARLAEMLEDWSRHLIRCPDCGRSRYYGRACK